MSISNSERKGNKLILTIDLADKPYQSKSALNKAAKAGQKPESVAATMLATTGGFALVNGLKVSLNVITA